MKTLHDLAVLSQFVGIGKRKSDDNFKSSYEILYPKYLITVNGEDFSFGGSPVDLGKIYGLKGSECLYLSNNKIFESIGYDKRRVIESTDLDKLTALIYTNKNRQLNDEEKLFALRCVIGDALTACDYATPGEMAKDFGYTDVDEAIRVFNACIDTKHRLHLNENELRNILDELSEMGIE